MSTKFIVFNKDSALEIQVVNDIEVSDKEKEFIMDSENTQIVLEQLYVAKTNKLYLQYLDKLVKIVQVGLVGENPHLDLAQSALEQLKSEIVNKESAKIKHKYLKQLGLIGLSFSIFFLCVYFVFIFFFPLYEVQRNFMILLLGSVIGVWLSSIISKKTLTFGDLNTINSNQLYPSFKILFVSLIAIVYGLFFCKQIISFKIGTISSDNFVNDPAIAFIFGIILGLNEKLIEASLMKKVEGIIK
ncbi:MAG: hypothetical protein NT007_19035 [Candidatus Kapabacteria bacterium]|nr:hypothetical protein [Candidatus Kapabacteria bacterium]